jgi:3-methyl-2-oxobutanoate hydroxymethyltransferase
MTSKNHGKVTLQILQEKKRKGEKITMITAYDYPTALIVDAAGVDVILVGDSLGMVVLGYENTMPVTMEDMLHHSKAVHRGCKRALLVGDMPFLSIRSGPEDAMKNSARFLHEGGVEAVKIEGGKKRKALVEAIVALDIPVMGHIGLTPQSLSRFGGYRVQGNSLDCAISLIEDAKAIEEAGVFSIVLECVPRELAEIVSRNVSVPTIGIGAGPGCDGQVLVLHDLLGLFDGTSPKFVRRYADLNQEIQTHVSSYLRDVTAGTFPADTESYHMPKEILAELENKVLERQWKL